MKAAGTEYKRGASWARTQRRLAAAYKQLNEQGIKKPAALTVVGAATGTLVSNKRSKLMNQIRKNLEGLEG